MVDARIEGRWSTGRSMSSWNRGPRRPSTCPARAAAV